MHKAIVKLCNKKTTLDHPTENSEGITGPEKHENNAKHTRILQIKR
ncbi:MAG: hypothetical protein QXL73_04640 [Thermoplasmata archaeon]